MKRGTFDDLTRILATSTSRREALRRIAGLLFGGTVGGVALGALSPEVALAGGGNSDCAHFCNAIFPPGADRGQCKSDAAHGTGLCYTCGPKSPGGSKPICCPENSHGQCTSYSSATCCGSGQTCTSGTCVTTCTTVVLSNGSIAQPCTDSSQCSSGNFCYPDVDGVHMYCTTGSGSETSCSNDSQCLAGEYCDADLPGCQTLVVCGSTTSTTPTPIQTTSTIGPS